MNEKIQRNTDNKILIDWLSFTSKIHSPESVIDLLGLTGCKFTDTYGMYGYQDRLIFDGISVHYNSHRKGCEGVWVEMSGQGCRAFETYCKYDDGFLYLFEYFKEYPDEYHITRLDVAYDDFQGIIPIRKFADDVLDINYVARFTKMNALCEPGHIGYTINCGSPKSDVRFRIYDKAYEKGYEGEEYFDWIRFEIQLRDDRAFNFIRQLNDYNLGEVFSGVILNYLRVVKPDKNDSNKRRWKTRKWFKDFLGHADRISLFTKCEQDYNLGKCEDYVYNHCGNSFDALVEIKGLDTVLKELVKRKPQRTEKYIRLINENKKSEENTLSILDFLKEHEQ